MPNYSSIIQRVFTLGGTDEAILLRGNEYTKPLVFNERWFRIRIGFLWGIYGDGSNNLLSCALNFGLCNNSANRTWSGTSSFFIGGCIAQYASGLTLTYNANSGSPFYSTTSLFVYPKINGTVSPASYAMTARVTTINDANPRRSLHLLDITKGSPNYTVAHTSAAAAHCSINMGMNDLYNACEQQATVPTVQGTAMSSGTPTAFAFSETQPVVLNCLNLHWNRWAFPIEIYGIAVYQVY